MAKTLVSESYPKYMTKVRDDMHKIMEDGLKFNSEYVRETGVKYKKVQIVKKHSLYKDSVRTLDPMVFVDILEKIIHTKQPKLYQRIGY